jgi:hemolysin III
MPAPTGVARYGRGEEIANTVTHGVGVALSIAGLAVLATQARALGTVWHVIGASIFGVTLIALYTTSTLYHGIPAPTAKPLLRAFDHAAIFLLIAGTYTPFTLVNLRGTWGSSLLIVIWSMALLGIALQPVLARQRAIVRAVPYVGFEPLLATVAPGGLALLLAGGLAYTGGAVFYVWRRVPFHHAIWHVFVLTGSACHYFAVLFFVIPVAV